MCALFVSQGFGTFSLVVVHSDLQRLPPPPCHCPSRSMELIDEVLLLAKPSGTLSERQRHLLPQLVESLKSLLQEKARILVHNAAGRPLLRSYSSDGTPLKVKQRVVATSGTRKVIREGGHAHEFLLEVGFLRYEEADGRCETFVAMRCPLPLTSGKDGWCLFAAARAFLPTLRELGHRGLSVEHLVCDRAVLPILDRRMR